MMKIVADWEKSGNGSGQHAADSADYGRVVPGQLWKARPESEALAITTRTTMMRKLTWRSS